jgi:hypothetical protein
VKRIATLIVFVAVTAMALSSAAQDRWRGPYSMPGRMRPGPAYRAYSPFARMPPRRVFAPPQQPGFGPPNSLGAGWRQQQDEARMAVRRGAIAPLGRVIEGIGRRTSGRPLDAGIEYEGGRAVYRVRWITDRGRRIDYIVDAATGVVLRGG